tara:strand:- start:10326 stop:11237 length:912 start_codon:yes stop_codon:yes gene_type:complete
MFAIGFVLMFTFAYLEAFNFKKISFNLEIKNVLTFILPFTGFLISIIIFLISINFDLSSPVIKENLVLLKDWRFYIVILSEIFGVWLFRKNYEINGNNLTAINFALFLSLVLVPVYSYFLSDLLGFQKTIMIGYQSPIEFYVFTGLILLSVIIFFFDKLKGKINNIFILFLLPVIFSNNMFVTSKIMQTYDPFFSYSIIVFFIALLFFIMAIKSKEFSKVNRSHLKLISYLSISWMIAIPANTIAVKLLAVEFVTLLKRVSQLISGLILDKMYNKNNNKFSIKDYFIIFFILFLGLGLYVLRG